MWKRETRNIAVGVIKTRRTRKRRIEIKIGHLRGRAQWMEASAREEIY